MATSKNQKKKTNKKLASRRSRHIMFIRFFRIIPRKGIVILLHEQIYSKFVSAEVVYQISKTDVELRPVQAYRPYCKTVHRAGHESKYTFYSASGLRFLSVVCLLLLRQRLQLCSSFMNMVFYAFM